MAPLILTPPYSMAEGMRRIDRHMTGQSVAKGVSQLKQRGLIKELKKDGQRYIQLTEKGRLEIVRCRLKQKQKSAWDGKWRIVIFDIPEVTRRDRDFLRSQLKWLGFLELQKSVWIFPYDIQRDLQDFIKLCRAELEGDIRFLTVERIDSDLDLRKYFALK